VASQFDSVNQLAQRSLHSDICRIYFSPDATGINIVSLFVQIIHLSMGISDGLQCGSGTRGAIVSRGLIEGARLGKAMGAEEHSFLGIAGIGQLIATLEKSTFYQYGLTTITNGTMPQPAIELLEAVLTINDGTSVHLPLTKAIYALGKQEISPTLLIDGLMRRKATRETTTKNRDSDQSTFVTRISVLSAAILFHVVQLNHRSSADTTFQP
jgi:glycerol-3-phosphate dehydrogenase (NAD(P)+)